MMDFAYKKPRENCGSYILPSISGRPPHRDMNIAIALSCMMAVMWLLGGKCEAAPELVGNVHRRFRNRPFLRRYAVEDLVGEDDEIDLNKRQHFDDYGHMRFGKREQFDDYGHMRFGRNHE